MSIKQKLIEQGFSEIEAEMYIVDYDNKAIELFEQCNCEVC